jgi:hypothetical protein
MKKAAKSLASRILPAVFASVKPAFSGARRLPNYSSSNDSSACLVNKANKADRLPVRSTLHEGRRGRRCTTAEHTPSRQGVAVQESPLREVLQPLARLMHAQSARAWLPTGLGTGTGAGVCRHGDVAACAARRARCCWR